ncbi:MAG: hypothetical protein NT161_01695 [Candidatus Nomurabacteria bacterium]|nr:hypothetical protein [Candidatus Nomurabacteria bacterium]
MANKKVSKTFKKKLLAQFAGSKYRHLVNGLISDHQGKGDKKKIILFLEENLECSKNRVRRKVSEIEAFIEEIREYIQKVEDIDFLLEKLKKL